MPASATAPAPVQPDLRNAARQDNIEPSLRPDPEAFHATGFALWNGGRTLPGIWIAYPDAEIARRVRLTNDETGAQADAAMFRRDPNLTGPRIIVSSEAAEALGLTPGQATAMTIDGLIYRTDTDTDIDPDTATAVASAAEQPDPALIDVPAEEAVADPVAPEVPPVAVTSAAAPATQDLATPPEAVAVEEILAEPDTAPASLTNDPETGEDEIAGAKAEDAEITGEEAQPVINAPAPQPEANLPDPAPVADPAPDVPGAITDGRNFIHVGIFGTFGNVAPLIEKLREAGLTASEVPLTLGGRKLTRVLVGPYQTVAERDAALKTVREIGPADAIPGRGPAHG
jgi:hypothetical protein